MLRDPPMGRDPLVGKHWVKQPNKLLSGTVSLFFYLILNTRLSNVPAHS